jgi:hypothetical protein
VWSAGSDTWDIYLGTAVAAAATAGQAPRWLPHANPAEAVAALLGQAGAAPGWLRPSVRLWLSAALARPFVLEPVQGVVSHLEVSALALARAPAATGLAAACLVSVDASNPGQGPKLAAAMPADLHAAVMLAAKRARVRIKSMRPWWALALEQACQLQGRGLQMLVLRDTDASLLLAETAGQWARADAYLPQPTPEEERALAARYALAQGLGSELQRHGVLAQKPTANNPQGRLHSAATGSWLTPQWWQHPLGNTTS